MTDVISDRDLYDTVLTGGNVTEEELTDYLKQHQNRKDSNGETQLLEFKDGLFFSKKLKKERNRKLRKYVAGFANAEGGLLVFGVDDNARILPVKEGRPKDINTWVTQTTRTLVGYIGISPRVATLELANGQGCIIFVATPRAPVLVPVVEGDETLYYLRNHMETVAMRESLLSDLLLGRRQQATLSATATTKYKLVDCDLDSEEMYGTGYLVSASLRIQNDSIRTAKALSGGILYACVERPRPKKVQTPPVSLSSMVELDQHLTEQNLELGLTPLTFPNSDESIPDLPPFRQIEMVARHMCFRLSNSARFRCAFFALYLLPQGSSPQWFQAAAVFRQFVVGIRPMPTEHQNKVTLARCAGRRPKIQVQFFDTETEANKAAEGLHLT